MRRGPPQLNGGFDAPPVTLQRAAYLIQNRRIVDRRWNCPRIAVSNFLDRAAQDFSRTRLRQPCHGYRELERGDGTDFLAHQCDDLLPDLGRRPVDASLQNDEA